MKKLLILVVGMFLVSLMIAQSYGFIGPQSPTGPVKPDSRTPPIVL